MNPLSVGFYHRAKIYLTSVVPGVRLFITSTFFKIIYIVYMFINDSMHYYIKVSMYKFNDAQRNLLNSGKVPVAAVNTQRAAVKLVRRGNDLYINRRPRFTGWMALVAKKILKRKLNF